MRIFGGTVFILGCVLLGVDRAFLYEEMIHNLKMLAKTVEFFVDQIQTEYATLPETICKVSFRQGGAIGKTLSDIANLAEKNEGKELFLIWQEETEKMDFRIPTQIRQDWIHIFDQTGFYDREGQISVLNNLLTSIRQMVAEMEHKQKDKNRLYYSMGFMVSLFVIILLW